MDGDIGRGEGKEKLSVKAYEPRWDKCEEQKKIKTTFLLNPIMLKKWLISHDLY